MQSNFLREIYTLYQHKWFSFIFLDIIFTIKKNTFTAGYRLRNRQALCGIGDGSVTHVSVGHGGLLCHKGVLRAPERTNHLSNLHPPPTSVNHDDLRRIPRYSSDLSTTTNIALLHHGTI